MVGNDTSIGIQYGNFSEILQSDTFKYRLTFNNFFYNINVIFGFINMPLF